MNSNLHRYLRLTRPCDLKKENEGGLSFEVKNDVKVFCFSGNGRRKKIKMMNLVDLSNFELGYLWYLYGLRMNDSVEQDGEGESEGEQRE